MAEPFIYLIDVAGTCNLQCPSCPNGNSRNVRRPKGLMDPSLFKKVVEKIRNEPVHVDTVCLYNWGEPFVHPHLPELIRRVKGEGWLCSVSTNLNQMRNIEEVLGAGLDHLRISLSGFTNRAYGRTHRRGDIEQVKANMRELCSLRGKLHSRCRVDVYYHQYIDNTAGEMTEMAKYCLLLDFEFAAVWAYLMPLEKKLDYFRGTLDPADQEVMSLFAIQEDELERLASPYKDRECGLRTNQMVVNFDGSVPLCCGVFDERYFIAPNFLDVSHQELQKRKFEHPLCAECRGHAIHMSGVYIPSEEIGTQAARNIEAYYERADASVKHESLPVFMQKINHLFEAGQYSEALGIYETHRPKFPALPDLIKMDSLIQRAKVALAKAR